MKNTHEEIIFRVDGSEVALADFLPVNADDVAICEWACVAKIGESFPALIECVRIA